MPTQTVCVHCDPPGSGRCVQCQATGKRGKVSCRECQGSGFCGQCRKCVNQPYRIDGFSDFEGRSQVL